MEIWRYEQKRPSWVSDERKSPWPQEKGAVGVRGQSDIAMCRKRSVLFNARWSFPAAISTVVYTDPFRNEL